MSNSEHNTAATPADEAGNAASKKLLYCSFCGKSQEEVSVLIKSHEPAICDECVTLAYDIVRGQRVYRMSGGEEGRTQDFLNLKETLSHEFQTLMDAIVAHGDDGVCISDVEFALTEFRGRLHELDDLCSTKDQGDPMPEIAALPTQEEFLQAEERVDSTRKAMMKMADAKATGDASQEEFDTSLADYEQALLTFKAMCEALDESAEASTSTKKRYTGDLWAVPSEEEAEPFLLAEGAEVMAENEEAAEKQIILEAWDDRLDMTNCSPSVMNLCEGDD